MVFLFLLIIPLLVAVFTFLVFNKKVIWQEFLIQIGVQMVFVAICCGILSWHNTSDTEILNGRVIEKKSENVSCRHDYCCMTCESCSTDSDGQTSCTTYCCMTCFEHSFDMDWLYRTTESGLHDINTIDRQGLKEPPRWTAIRVGEPSSSYHSYDNYIKAAPDSLFREQGLVERFQKDLPSYPGKVYDHYRIDRVVLVGVVLSDLRAWNEELSEVNARLNPDKQANVVLVLVKDKPHEYFMALRQHYLGGKKNDVIVVVSVNDSINIQWADAMSLTDHKELMVKLRDNIVDLKAIDSSNPGQVLGVVENNVRQYYVRKSMEDFKYLAANITPSVTQWLVCLILGFLISIGLSIYMVANEFDEE